MRRRLRSASAFVSGRIAHRTNRSESSANPRDHGMNQPPFVTNGGTGISNRPWIAHPESEVGVYLTQHLSHRYSSIDDRASTFPCACSTIRSAWRSVSAVFSTLMVYQVSRYWEKPSADQGPRRAQRRVLGDVGDVHADHHAARDAVSIRPRPMAARSRRSHSRRRVFVSLHLAVMQLVRRSIVGWDRFRYGLLDESPQRLHPVSRLGDDDVLGDRRAGSRLRRTIASRRSARSEPRSSRRGSSSRSSRRCSGSCSPTFSSTRCTRSRR